MSMPVTPNTTCDIYRTGNAPPAAPDVAAQACHLTADFYTGTEHGEGDATARRYSHVLLVGPGVDIRDDYNLGVMGANFDNVYVPDQNGTRFSVIFVERKLAGTPHDHKKVYLARWAPAWPTQEV